MTPRVLVVGDVIDDVLVQPSGPIRHDTDTPARITRAAGGSGANAAVWLADAGADVRFAGRVGRSDLDRHRATFAAAGVDAVLADDRTRPTGTIVILVDPADGRRTMLTDRGANLGLCATDLPDTLLEGRDLLHVSGYCLFDATVRTAVLGLLGRARAAGLRCSVDPSSVAFLDAVGPQAFRTWIAGVDVLLPNLDEARLLTGAARPDEAAVRLLDVASTVAVTLGSQGAVVATRGGQPYHLDVPVDIEVVDTTGAGDAFTGAFLASWLRDGDPDAAGRQGIAAAARAVSVTGARPASGGDTVATLADLMPTGTGGEQGAPR